MDLDRLEHSIYLILLLIGLVSAIYGSIVVVNFGIEIFQGL